MTVGFAECSPVFRRGTGAAEEASGDRVKASRTDEHSVEKWADAVRRRWPLRYAIQQRYLTLSVSSMPAARGGQPAQAEKRWRNAACSRISSVTQASTTTGAETHSGPSRWCAGSSTSPAPRRPRQEWPGVAAARRRAPPTAAGR